MWISACKQTCLRVPCWIVEPDSFQVWPVSEPSYLARHFQQLKSALTSSDPPARYPSDCFGRNPTWQSTPPLARPDAFGSLNRVVLDKNRATQISAAYQHCHRRRCERQGKCHLLPYVNLRKRSVCDVFVISSTLLPGLVPCWGTRAKAIAVHLSPSLPNGVAQH